MKKQIEKYYFQVIQKYWANKIIKIEFFYYLRSLKSEDQYRTSSCISSLESYSCVFLKKLKSFSQNQE